MKKLFTLLLITIITTTYGQNADFGIKGGLNFRSTEDLITFTDDTNLNSEGRVGFHLGVLGKFELFGIFVQPEIIFTRLNSNADDFNFTLSKIDVPLLAGLNFLGPLNLKGGPSLQYAITNNFEGNNIAEGNNFTIGYQVGIGIQLGRLGIDARYESAFQENDPIMIPTDIPDSVGISADTRPSQWILSASFFFK